MCVVQVLVDVTLQYIHVYTSLLQVGPKAIVVQPQIPAAPQIQKKRGAKNIQTPSRLYEVGHYPELLPVTETWSKPQARCRVCSSKGKRTDTRYVCGVCPGKPGLCVKECYRIWHTKEDITVGHKVIQKYTQIPMRDQEERLREILKLTL